MARPEDVIRNRERLATHERALATEAEQQRIEQERRQHLVEVRSDADRLLDVLRLREYPDGQVFRIFTRMTFFGREKRIQRAAWPICDYPYEFHGDEVTGTVYLLSDGSFAWTPGGSIAILDFDEVVEARGATVRPSLAGIAAGLKERLEEYEV